MSTPKGYPAQQKLDRVKAEHATIEPIRAEQHGLSVNAHVYVYEVGIDAVEADSTVSTINATAHLAVKGDIIRFTSGALNSVEVKVQEVTANTIVLVYNLPSVPATAVTFQILRPKYPVVAADGTIAVSIAQSPIAFVLDGVDTEVQESTTVPANTRPLPVKLMNDSGVEFGTSTSPIRVDPTGTTTQPVSAASLPLPAGASTSALQTSGNSSLTSIDGKLGALGQKLMTGSAPVVIASDQSTLPVSAASLPLPTGASTSALQTSGNTSLSSIDGKLGSLGQKLMTGSAPVVIASDQSTLPVSAASLPLPTGAATEATLSNLNSKVTAVNTGAVTISAALPAGTNNIGDVDVLTLPSIPTGANRIGSIDVNLDVIDFIDTTPVLDTSVTNITASAGAPLQIVAALAAAVKKIRVNDTTGEFIGIYTGAAASEILQCIAGPGIDGDIEVLMSASERVSVRNMANAAISVGKLCIQFYG